MKDVTKHLPEPHASLPIPVPKHTQRWYELFDGKCPTCGVEAKFK